MSDRQYVLVVDDDPVITSALEMLLQHEGRTILLCSDLESAELMLARYPVTHVLSDVQFSGPFRFEGLHFLSRIRARRSSCRIVLMTGLADAELRSVAAQFGAAAVLAKPFELQALEAALRLDETSEGEYESLRVLSLPEVLQGGLDTAFQPIVSFDGTIFGFEALTRVQGAWAGGGPAELFAYAASRQQLPELNLAAVSWALTHGRALAGETALFLNVDPMTFEHGDLVKTVREAAARNGVPLDRIVLEITERSGFADSATALAALEQLREDGVQFALDDHGSAYSHLSLIDRIRPSFIKISQTFGTAFDKHPARARVVRHIAALARDFGCRTILEGIETASTARAAAAAGIDLVQGYYFGRPQAASQWGALRHVAA